MRYRRTTTAATSIESARRPENRSSLSIPTPPRIRESYETALLAAGGVLELIDHVMAGKADNGFAMVRPPGHHAEADRAMGFCFFNNVAIGARYLRSRARARADPHRRLGRSPRKRNAAELLRGQERALRVSPPVPALPGDGSGERGGCRRWSRVHGEHSVSRRIRRRGVRRGVPTDHRADRPPVRPAVRSDLRRASTPTGAIRCRGCA